MKKKSVINKPTNINDLVSDDLYEDISTDWELKAKQLQDRRWKLMRRAMKEDYKNGRIY